MINSVYFSMKEKEVDLICGGAEYIVRKTIPPACMMRQTKGLKAFAYERFPRKAVRVSFLTRKVIFDDNSYIWNVVKDKCNFSDHDSFYDYVANAKRMKNKVYAVKIDEVKVFDDIIPENCFKNFISPKSFRYLDKEEENKLKALIVNERVVKA